ncbi:MAG: hypothetical protein AB1830_04170 [Pseudomonadota bacterium]
MPSERGASHVALVIGTQKGLFVARSSLARARWRLEGPHLAGYEILHAWLDPRNSQTGYAAAAHPVWGAHLYRTGDAGRTCTPLTRWLPQSRAYVSVLREAMDADGIEPCGLYFGTTNGQLFASRDGSEHRRVPARFLPRILSVRAAVVARDPDR